MKKTISIIAATTILLSTNMASAEPIHTSNSDKFIAQLSALVSSTASDDYIGSLNLTIGSDTMTLDGEQLKIDSEGSVPIMENDTTLLPIRGIAEAIGAEVDYYAPSQTVSLCSEETTVTMHLGSAEIEINGETSQMPVEAKLVNDRTLIPLRAAAEVLGCDVSWDGTDQTIMLTRPYQTKRVIVHSENADTTNSSTVIKSDNITIMQFDTETQARECVKANENKGFIAEPDYVYKADSLSWGTDRISAPQYYNKYADEQSDLIVAVIDSGLDSSHSCFRNKTVNGYDFYRNDNTPEDENGHGTHVASTIADVTAGFNKIKIMPLKTADINGNSYSTLLNAALNYAVEHGAKVVNLSLGGYHDDVMQRKGVENAISHGVTVVAAAGNENVNIANNFFSPACIPGVVAVSAVDSNNQKASFSNYGNEIIDIAAPGVRVNGAAIGGGTTIKSGTSMATPHIAGAIALIRSANPGYSSTDAINALKGAASNLGNSAYYGAGVANLGNLVPYSPPKSDISVNTLDARNISQTNATVYGSASYSGTRPSEVGLYFGTSPDSMKKVAHESINFSKNPFDIWYDLNNEAGQYLSANTTYYYRVYGIQNGVETDGETKSFTTLRDNSGGENSYTAYVVNTGGDTLAINSIPQKGNQIGEIPVGAALTVYPGRTSGNWYWVEYNGISGYSYKDYISANPYLGTRIGIVHDTDGSLAINSKPQKGNQIGIIPEGAFVTVYTDKTSGNWYWVEYTGVSGYSYKDYIALQ